MQSESFLAYLSDCARYAKESYSNVSEWAAPITLCAGVAAPSVGREFPNSWVGHSAAHLIALNQWHIYFFLFVWFVLLFLFRSFLLWKRDRGAIKTLTEERDKYLGFVEARDGEWTVYVRQMEENHAMSRAPAFETHADSRKNCDLRKITRIVHERGEQVKAQLRFELATRNQQSIKQVQVKLLRAETKRRDFKYDALMRFDTGEEVLQYLSHGMQKKVELCKVENNTIDFECDEEDAPTINLAVLPEDEREITVYLTISGVDVTSSDLKLLLAWNGNDVETEMYPVLAPIAEVVPESTAEHKSPSITVSVEETVVQENDEIEPTGAPSPVSNQNSNR